jgi:hypothetical protein
MPQSIQEQLISAVTESIRTAAARIEQKARDARPQQEAEKGKAEPAPMVLTMTETACGTARTPAVRRTEHVDKAD